MLDWFGWICHLCGVAGEVSGWGDGEAAKEGDLSELRLGLREVSGELGNSRRKEGGGSTGVEMCWWRKWKKVLIQLATHLRLVKIGVKLVFEARSLDGEWGQALGRLDVGGVDIGGGGGDSWKGESSKRGGWGKQRGAL